LQEKILYQEQKKRHETKKNTAFPARRDESCGEARGVTPQFLTQNEKNNIFARNTGQGFMLTLK
jgi:hypothetical protein